MRTATIERDPQDGGYVIRCYEDGVDHRGYPYYAVLRCRDTLWGARRVAHRWVRGKSRPPFSEEVVGP